MMRVSVLLLLAVAWAALVSGATGTADDGAAADGSPVVFVELGAGARTATQGACVFPGQGHEHTQGHMYTWLNGEGEGRAERGAAADELPAAALRSHITPRISRGQCSAVQCSAVQWHVASARSSCCRATATVTRSVPFVAGCAALRCAPPIPIPS